MAQAAQTVYSETELGRMDSEEQLRLATHESARLAVSPLAHRLQQLMRGNQAEQSQQLSRPRAASSAPMVSQVWVSLLYLMSRPELLVCRMKW